MMRTMLIATVVLVGGGLGGYLALQVRRPSAEPSDPSSAVSKPREISVQPVPAPKLAVPAVPAVKETYVLPDQPGFYLAHLRRSGVEIDQMTPLLLSPFERENVRPSCPERLAVVPGHQGYVDYLKPYLDAVGPIDLPTPNGLAHEVVASMKRQWKHLNVIASGPVTSPPLRILVKHYPRPDLPGHCIVIRVTFYTVADPYFDEHETVDPESAKQVRGIILELARTYQLQGGLKLVAAEAEVHSNVRLLGPRRSIGEVLGSQKVGRIGTDGAAPAHFLIYGGGERYGMVWLDRAAGLAAPEPHGLVYRMVRETPGPPAIKTAPLPDSLRDALIALVSRS